MAKQKYPLNKGEKIVYKVECCRHGFWAAYTDCLVVTNQALILEQYGLFSNFKGIIRYPYDEINQAIIGAATNGEKQLEIYLNNRSENFAPQSGKATVLNTLLMAINDQMSEDADLYDFNFYHSIENGVERDISRIEHGARVNSDTVLQDGLGFVGDVAMNMLKSGNFTAKGLQKSVNKATRKQKSKQMFGGIADELLDDLGVHDIQDCFTEIGNEFREGFGLKPKLTHAEIKEMREREEQQREAEIIRQKREAYSRQVTQARQAAQSKKVAKHKDNPEPPSTQENSIAPTPSRMNVNEQLDMLKKLKELLDLGALTPEEFEEKKQEILKS